MRIGTQLGMALLLAAASAAGAAEQPLRTWTFHSGKTIEARFVEVTREALQTAEGGKADPTLRVVLEKEDGKRFGALYEALSAEDRACVAATVRRGRSDAARRRASMSEDAYLALPEQDMDVAVGSLLIAKERYPGLDIPKHLDRVDAMAEELRGELQGKTEPHQVVHTINDYLFSKQKFQYESGTHFLNEVLDRNCGSCAGLTTLYLALAHRLGLPCYGIDVPRHILVRYDSGDERINVEPMAHGGVFTDEWYIEQMNIPRSAVEKGLYLRNMTKKQVLASLLNNRGNVWREEGEPDRAIASLDKAIRLNPKDCEAYYSRGQAYNDKKDYPKGLADCEQAIELNPNEARAYNNRAVARQNLDDLAGALEDFGKALALEPDLAGAYCNRAYVYMRLEDYPRALEDANRAVTYEPDRWNHRFVRGSVLSELGRLDQAIDDLNAAAGIDPENPLTYMARCLTYAKLGARDETFADIRTFVGMMPDVKDYMRDLENFSRWHGDPEYQAIFQGAASPPPSRREAPDSRDGWVDDLDAARASGKPGRKRFPDGVVQYVNMYKEYDGCDGVIDSTCAEWARIYAVKIDGRNDRPAKAIVTGYTPAGEKYDAGVARHIFTPQYAFTDNRGQAWGYDPGDEHEPVLNLPPEKKTRRVVIKLEGCARVWVESTALDP